MSRNSDWRNYPGRREDALRGGQQHPPQSQVAYDNFGYISSSPPPPSKDSYKINIPRVGLGRSDPSGPRNDIAVVGRADYMGGPPPPMAYSAPTPMQYNHNRQYDEPYQGYPPQEPPQMVQMSGKIEDTVDGEVFEGFAKKRKCRDVICLALFLAFAIVTIAVVVYAAVKGDYNYLRGCATEGCNACGIQNSHIEGIQSSGKDNRQFPYLFYARDDNRDEAAFQHLGTDRLYYKVCVSQCPIEYRVSMGKCVPKMRNLTTAADFFTKTGAREYSEELTEDLEQSWKYILWMCLIAVGVALVMTLLLRLFAGVIIWVVVIGSTVAAIAATVTLWIFYVRENNKTNSSSTDWDKNKKNTYLAFAIITTIVTLLILIIVIGMRKRIALVIQLFKEAGKAIHAVPLILLQPIWTFLCLGAACITWFCVLLLLETAGEPEPYNVTFCTLKKNEWIPIMRWWNIFAILWMTQFIVGCQHVIIAGTISKWFFTRDKSRLGWPILKSTSQLIKYHLGSVAFGSLIVAIVKFIRYILNYLQKRLGGTNVICKALLCCCQCFTWCLEKFLIFLNRNAYIEIAIYGYGFCKSARKAFKVLVSNALRVAAINSIGDFVLFLAKAVIVIVTVLIGYQMLKDKEEIHHIWIPLLIGAFFAYFIAHCFIGVYEMAIDTIFLCFCEDCERNDGMSKPYYMSTGLMEFVKNSQKIVKENDKKRKSS